MSPGLAPAATAALYLIHAVSNLLSGDFLKKKKKPQPGSLFLSQVFTEVAGVALILISLFFLRRRRVLV